MSYQGSFTDIIYPQADRTPAVARYRIVCFDEGSAMHSIIHLPPFATDSPSAPAIDAGIDLILNKIVDFHFSGVRIDHVHLVVEAHDGVFEYPIEFDATEFQRRGNPSSVQGSGQSQTVSIDSKDVVGGSVNFFAWPAKRRALSVAMESALR